MQIDAKDLTESNSPHIGKELWICDYRRPDLDKKPIRSLIPTLATLVVADGKVYYSLNWFVAKSGPKTPIKIFDNTGYRWYPGTPILVFDNEAECRAAFNAQLLAIETGVQTRIDTVIVSLKADKAALEALRKKHS